MTMGLRWRKKIFRPSCFRKATPFLSYVPLGLFLFEVESGRTEGGEGYPAYECRTVGEEPTL